MVAWEKVKGGFVTRGLLGADDKDDAPVGDEAAAADLALDELLGSAMHDLVAESRTGAGSDADDLLLEAEEVVRGGEVAPVDDSGDTLGWFGMAIDRLRGVDKVDALRTALLDWLEGDDTFAIDKRDDTFESSGADNAKPGPAVFASSSTKRSSRLRLSFSGSVSGPESFHHMSRSSPSFFIKLRSAIKVRNLSLMIISPMAFSRPRKE